jgi:uncharacterized membrane protein
VTAIGLGGYVNDLIALLVVAAMITAYEAYLHRLARRNPGAVLSSTAAIARARWVEAVMSDHGNGILAVQTLRNSTMAASFLASTAVLLMVGVLTLSGQAQSLETTWHVLNVFGTRTSELWLAKLLGLLLLLFFAFFNFMNAIRVYTHVGYMASVPQSPDTALFPTALVVDQLNRGGNYFRIGMRTYYYLIPLVCWLFGPTYMIGSTLVLVFFLLPQIDRISRSPVDRA